MICLRSWCRLKLLGRMPRTKLRTDVVMKKHRRRRCKCPLVGAELLGHSIPETDLVLARRCIVVRKLLEPNLPRLRPLVVLVCYSCRAPIVLE